MVAGFVRGVPSPRFDFSISTGTQLEDPRHTAQRFHSRFGIEGKRERSIDERGPCDVKEETDAAARRKRHSRRCCRMASPATTTR